MASKFKADAIVQNYKMKENRDIIRAKAEIAIAQQMGVALEKIQL